MSVLVKGMKMPKSCAACQFRISPDERVDPFTEYCYITNERLGYFNNKRAKWNKERRKNCPLVEVSEDAVSPCEVCPLVETTEEERHGRWVMENDRYYHWHCSECGYVIGTMKMDAHFCPNCGAKMDE